MAVQIRSLTKRYGERVALADVTLEARDGETLGLVGPNGAGKTTLIHVLLGVLRPDSGRVQIDGGPHSVGFCPQANGLYEDLTAEEHLRLLGRLRGLRGDRLRQRMDAVLAEASLEERRGDRVSTYSGGLRRRLGLACALIDDPPLLVLDEPTAAIDPHARENLFELLEREKARSRTILIATHSMEAAERLCDRVAVLDGGRLRALDTVPALCRRPDGTTGSLAEAFLRLTGRALRA